MKLPLLSFIMLTTGSIAPALAAEPFIVTSQISAVTVYSDRAIVTRTAQLQLTAGQVELVFEKLPASLVDQSLQVAGKGSANTTILDVNARTIFIQATADPRVKALEDQIETEQKQGRIISDSIALLKEQRALLGKIETAVTTPPGKESAAPRAGFDEWQKLLVFANETRAKLAIETQALDAQQKTHEERLNALNAQLNELHSHSEDGRSYKTVTLRVASAAAGTFDVSLGYAVQGAAWTPAYDARLRAEQRAVELTYFGIVRQRTGEDWKNVALTLSTARPSLGGGAPELSPWFLDVYQPRVSRDEMSAKASAPAPARAMMRQQFNSLAGGGAAAEASAEEEKEARFAVTTVDTAATSASFKIPTPATVLSDNTSQKVGIASAKLAATLQYQAVPRSIETAFLSAYVNNTTEFPFLAGSMNTFLDDAFIATSSLKTVMPGEKFELALGADEGIAVKRKVVNRFSEETGITNSGRRVTYEFLVTVTNNKKTAERVVFKEVVPISRNEKIVVKLQSPAERDIGTTEKPKEITREADGKLVWRLDLKPGEKREATLKFSIDHPAEIQVTGLEP